MMFDDKPYWWPQPVDAEWREQIRRDYPEDTAGMDDETLDYEYAEGWSYADVWDHLGDARHDWERLADAFLKLVEETGKTPADFLPAPPAEEKE